MTVFAMLEQLVGDALGPDAVAALRSPQGLPLHGSIGVDVYLRGDGSVWAETYELALDGPNEVTRVELQSIERTINLVIAARHRPELRFLVPARTDASRDCLRCDGLGHLQLTPERQSPGMYLHFPEPNRVPQNPSEFRVYCRDCGGVGFV